MDPLAISASLQQITDCDCDCDCDQTCFIRWVPRFCSGVCH